MRKILALVALLPVLAAAQGVARPVRLPEATLFTVYRAAVIATSSSLAGFVLPSSRGFIVSAFTVTVSAQAAGTGNITLRVTDGTRNCDSVVACAATGTSGWGSPGQKRFATTGTCVFAPGTEIVASVLTSACSVTHPTVLIASVVGTWTP